MLFETEASIDGEIAPSPAGEHGFGYDPIFYYPPLRKTTGRTDARGKKRRLAPRPRFRDSATVGYAIPSCRSSCSIVCRSPSSSGRTREAQLALGLRARANPRRARHQPQRFRWNGRAGRSQRSSTCSQPTPAPRITNGGGCSSGGRLPAIRAASGKRLLERVHGAGQQVALAGLAGFHRLTQAARDVLDVSPAELHAARRDEEASAQQLHERGVNAAGVAGTVDGTRHHDDERSARPHHRHRHFVVREPFACGRTR